MKTTNEILAVVRATGLVLAVTFIAGLMVSQAQAQYKPTGDDGITASPRLRQQLDERRARTSTATATLPSMACPKCKDTLVSQLNTESKGVGARTQTGNTTKLVAQHLCGGCGVDWTIAGTGKAKHSVATHKCSGCGSEKLDCCSGKGTGDVATKGMEKKFQVAPVK
jgi:hypothetical protein